MTGAESTESGEREDSVNDSSLDPSKPVVLLLGWVDHEGIMSSLRASGRQFKKKMLESTPENWESIVSFFDDYRVSAVLAKLSPAACQALDDISYQEVKCRLFERIARVPNIVFLYEDIFTGEQTDEWREQYKPYPAKEVLYSAVDFLKRYRVELIPYRRNAEVNVIAEAFLDDTARNLLFRLYVPRGQIWSNETDRFLQLFQDYLAKVDRIAVRLDQRRTDYGTIYEYHGEALPGERDLSNEFRDFSSLMDICASNVAAAAAVLSAKSIDAREITMIIERYAKEARRLHLDIKHEAESKIIAIRHRLESELIDLAPTDHEWATIMSAVASAIPTLSYGASGPSRYLTGPPAHTGSQNVTYNIRPQIINTVNGVVAQEIYGDQHLMPEHMQILELIRLHAPENAREIETAVYEIADRSEGKVDRLKATQKIKTFLLEVAKRTGDVACGVLQTYIERQLGL